MNDQVSFIHAADLHLDSPFKGLAHIPEHIFHQLKDSTFEALDQLVQTAIEKKVDFVLITGDLFDNEKQSLKAQVRLRKGFETLQQYHINVYLSYGNHDFIKGNIHPITYPDNVFIFPDERVTHFVYQRDGIKKAAVYGFSYESRAVTDDKIPEYQLCGADAPFHIAMLHGSLHSNTDHDVYAPFYLTELIEKDFDYWALGHIHQRAVLHENPFVVYPGNIQGRNRKEVGEKGCYHVVLSEKATDITFLPLQSLQFNNLTVNVSDCTEIHQLETVIRDEINAYTSGLGPQLLQLNLKSGEENLEQWVNEEYLEEMMELVNETLIHQSNWKYIFRFVIKSHFSSVDDNLAQGQHFVGELIRQFDGASIQPYLKELYHHKRTRKYLNPNTNEEEMAIKDKAKQLLVHELLKNGGE